MNAYQYIIQTFPWLTQLGMAAQIQQWAADPAMTPEGIVAEVRNTQQWKAMFAGIYRADGTLRATEGEFLRTRADYRTLLRQYGRPDYEYDDPEDFRAFFEQDIQPDELQERFQVYETVKRSDQFVREAFYVYAGMSITEDDLYLMATNPVERDKYVREYNARVAANPLDYPTWITRATEAGLQSVTNLLEDLRQEGVLTEDAVSRVSGLHPDFARQMADALYHGGTADGTFLNLNELMYSFQYALIGGAASQAGLGLPDEGRLEQLRQAGVDRAKALEGYSKIASQGEAFQGMLTRAGSQRFSTNDFEKALFLQTGEAETLRRAQAQEEALGQAGGGAAFSQGRTGGLQQRGLRPA